MVRTLKVYNFFPYLVLKSWNEFHNEDSAKLAEVHSRYLVVLLLSILII